jgi:Flp pilus assembly protein TadB
MSGLVEQLSALLAQLLVIAAATEHRWETVIAPQPGVLVWPLLFALGVGLVFGLGSRPLPLAERVRRLSLEVRMRETAEPPIVDRAGAQVLPGVPGTLLNPLLADMSGVLEHIARRLAPGLIGSQRLERELRLIWPGRSVGVHARNKALTGLALALVLPFAAAMDVLDTPAVLWLLLGAVGFVIPDLELRYQLKLRRDRVVAELPATCDHLAIALSGHLSVEQALRVMAEASVGEVASELQGAMARIQTGLTLPQALDELEARNDQPELTGLFSVLRSAYQDGTRAAALAAAHADGLRALERASVVEQSGKAATRMVIPMALFSLPVLVVVLGAPAVVQLMNLGPG